MASKLSLKPQARCQPHLFSLCLQKQQVTPKAKLSRSREQDTFARSGARRRPWGKVLGFFGPMPRASPGPLEHVCGETESERFGLSAATSKWPGRVARAGRSTNRRRKFAARDMRQEGGRAGMKALRTYMQERSPPLVQVGSNG